MGRLDRPDPNVVLGLFLYDGDSPEAAHHEVDIEFSRWGDPGGRAG
ncbi:hypothetical protein ACVGVM_08935 [Pseudonocardia bannensis]|uniref:Uncharacterized protein n=1 Tax=Pseudonocardia bannensis TaxID=630973 RepID=A0A848DBF1_9PSEU|nr:hypothetical protein [Pseudonocardia bannensis]NMH90262.1 hypothetical protein [Pseudonocardia bannensis]